MKKALSDRWDWQGFTVPTWTFSRTADQFQGTKHLWTSLIAQFLHQHHQKAEAGFCEVSFDRKAPTFR